ncbi:MAG: stage III sporulation protein AC [Bianqueaceae bacterium]
MEIEIVFKIAAVGIIVAVLNQVLSRAGREDQAMMTTLAGLIVVLFWVVQYINGLFTMIRSMFNLWADQCAVDTNGG